MSMNGVLIESGETSKIERGEERTTSSTMPDKRARKFELANELNA